MEKKVTFDELFPGLTDGLTVAKPDQETHLDAMREQIAAQFGIEEPSTLQGRRLEMDYLRENGIWISVHCHGTSMFTRTVSWEELGIPHDDPRVGLITRGIKHVIPKKASDKLLSLERRARYALRKWGVSVGGMTGYYWLCGTVAPEDEGDPDVKSAYEKWKEAHDAILAELEEHKAMIIENLDEWRDVRLPEVFGEIADKAYTQRKAITNGSNGTRKAYRELIIRAAQQAMPIAKDVQYGIWFGHSTQFLLNPKEVEAELAVIDEIRAVSKAKRDVVEARASAEKAKATKQEDVAWAERRAELSRLEAMREAEIAHAAEELQRMGSPLQTVLDSMESQLYSAVVAMRDKVSAKGYLHGKQKEQANNVIELYNTLKGLGGDRLRSEILKLEIAMETPGEKFATDGDAVVAALNELARQTVEAAQRVAKSAGSGRAAYVDF